ARAQRAAVDLDALDPAALGLFHELGVRHVARPALTCVELPENGEQNQGDDDPDCCLRERVIHLYHLTGFEHRWLDSTLLTPDGPLAPAPLRRSVATGDPEGRFPPTGHGKPWAFVAPPIRKCP